MFNVKVPDSPNRLVTKDDVARYAGEMEEYIEKAEEKCGFRLKRIRGNLNGAKLTWEGRVTVNQLEKMLAVWRKTVDRAVENGREGMA